MTVAGKINTLVISIAAIAGCLLVAHTIQSEYRSELTRVVEQSSAAVQAQPNLQLDIYYDDSAALKRALDNLLSLSPAIKFAMALDPTGTPLIESGELTSRSALPLVDVRGDTSPVERAIQGRSGEDAGIDSFAERIFDLTLPILSLINPTAKAVSRSDFSAALAAPDKVESREPVWINVEDAGGPRRERPGGGRPCQAENPSA